MTNFTRIARLVQEKPVTKRMQADLGTRPLRLAFVIRDDSTPLLLASVLEYNTSIWGGYYNCLIPTDGEKIDKRWWSSLLQHAPDKVIFCGDQHSYIVSPELVQSIEREVQPFSVHEWSYDEGGNLDKSHQQGGVGRIGCMPMVYPLQHLINNLHRPVEPGSSKVRIPRISLEHPFYLCVAAQMGILGDFYDDALQRTLEAEHVEFDTEDIKEYLRLLAEFHDHVSPLDLTRRYLRARYPLQVPERPRGLSLVLIGDNWVQDLCLFWSLRFAPREPFYAPQDPHYRELLVPIGRLRSKHGLQSLVTACTSDGPWCSRHITLVSQSVSRDSLKRFAARLSNGLGGKVKIDVLTQPLRVSVPYISSTSERDEVLVEDDIFSFRILSPKFGEVIEDRAAEWVIDIDLKDNSGRSLELPFSSRLNHLLCGSPDEELVKIPGYWLRYAFPRIAQRVSRRTSLAHGTLVNASATFPPAFNDKGFAASLSDKHPYIEGFLALLGSSNNVRLLEEQSVRQLFWQMKKSGRTYTFCQIASTLQLGQKCSTVVDNLVRSRVLLRGMSFRCESCGLLRWYPLNELAEVMQCAGCLNLIQPPVGAEIVFKLNELADRAISQGAIPVLLTQHLLSMHNFEHTLALFGLRVKDDDADREVEVDFVTTCKGCLLLAECKELKDGADPKHIREAKRQLTKLVEMARRVAAPIVLLSTLLPETSEELANHVLQLNHRSRGKVAVHLVSLTKMKLVNLQPPFKMVEFQRANLFHPLDRNLPESTE